MVQVLERLAQGASIALISDAGMPAVSDPGAKLIVAAVHARHSVIPVPGVPRCCHSAVHPYSTRGYL